jgi:hypothetical protein
MERGAVAATRHHIRMSRRKTAMKGTAMERTTKTDTHRRDRGFAALLLLTAGLMVLAERALHTSTSAVPLAIGIGLLVWAVVARSAGLLVAGGVVTGVGSGVLLASGPLRGADANLIGGAFLLSIAGGFALIALLSWISLRDVQHWAWITAPFPGVIGAGLLAGPDSAATVIGWLLPVALIAAGIIVALRTLRSRRPRA